MSIRAVNKNKTKWVIDYYPAGQKGKRERLTFIGSEDEARHIELGLRQKRYAVKPVNPRVIDVVLDWQEWARATYAESTYIDMVKAMKKILPQFGNIHFSQLNQGLVEEYKVKRHAENAKKRTINKELSYFSSICSWATTNKYAAEPAFVPAQFRRVTSPAITVPEYAELDALIANIEERYKGIVLLMNDAGLRRQEALRLEVKNVRIKDGIIKVLGKGSKWRSVPIATERLMDELKKATAGRTKGYLYTNPKTGKPYTGIRKALERAALKAGISDRIYHHLLRHCYGTYATEAGVHPRALQQMMGHEKLSTTEKYGEVKSKFIVQESRKMQKYHEENGTTPDPN